MSLFGSVCQPSTLRMLIWPEVARTRAAFVAAASQRRCRLLLDHRLEKLPNSLAQLRLNRVEPGSPANRGAPPSSCCSSPRRNLPRRANAGYESLNHSEITPPYFHHIRDGTVTEAHFDTLLKSTLKTDTLCGKAMEQRYTIANGVTVPRAPPCCRDQPVWRERTSDLERPPVL
jgi:hypothetical protein